MGEDPKYVINKMLVNFDSKVDDSMRQKIADKGYTIQELLTVASMIEKETDGTDHHRLGHLQPSEQPRRGDNGTPEH